jgi:hypothetical protein
VKLDWDWFGFPTWPGEIQTHRAKSATHAWITPGGEIEATLGKQAAMKMSNVRVTDSGATGRMPGDLDINCADGSPMSFVSALSAGEPSDGRGSYVCGAGPRRPSASVLGGVEAQHQK